MTRSRISLAFCLASLALLGGCIVNPVPTPGPEGQKQLTSTDVMAAADTYAPSGGTDTAAAADAASMDAAADAALADDAAMPADVTLAVDATAADAGGCAPDRVRDPAGGCVQDTCEALQAAVGSSVASFLANADTCASDDDCMDIGTSTACHPTCGAAIAKANADEFAAMLGKLDAALCTGFEAKCGFQPIPPCLPPNPACVAGHCVRNGMK